MKKSPKKNRKIKKLFKFLAVLFILLVVFVAGIVTDILLSQEDIQKTELELYNYQTKYQSLLGQNESLVSLTLEGPQDPTILETLKSVGAKDYSTLSMSVSSDMLKDCNQNKDSIAGCYSNSTIIARKGYESNKTTAAHEYLHYIWDKHRLDKDHRLESDLIVLLTRTPALQARLQHYYDNNILRLTELFSFACTEIQDSRLTPYIVQKCNEYIDRSTLQMIF